MNEDRFKLKVHNSDLMRQTLGADWKPICCVTCGKELKDNDTILSEMDGDIRLYFHKECYGAD